MAGPCPATIPNAVRVAERPARAAPPHDLLFVGNLSYRPNVDAAWWLCRSILPELGATTVALVGSAPVPDVRLLGEMTGVTLTADVPSVAPWYEASKIAVVPLRGGAGSRTKILEAWAHGMPVVTTSIGAEGIPVGDAALVADEPEAFVAACRVLLDDTERRRELAEAGITQLRRLQPEERRSPGSRVLWRAPQSTKRYR